jgi:hypothetical protein
MITHCLLKSKLENLRMGSSRMAIDREKIKVWAMYLYTVLIVVAGFVLLAKS